MDITTAAVTRAVTKLRVSAPLPGVPTIPPALMRRLVQASHVPAILPQGGYAWEEYFARLEAHTLNTPHVPLPGTGQD